MQSKEFAETLTLLKKLFTSLLHPKYCWNNYLFRSFSLADKFKEALKNAIHFCMNTYWGLLQIQTLMIRRNGHRIAWTGFFRKITKKLPQQWDTWKSDVNVNFCRFNNASGKINPKISPFVSISACFALTSIAALKKWQHSFLKNLKHGVLSAKNLFNSWFSPRCEVI